MKLKPEWVSSGLYALAAGIFCFVFASKLGLVAPSAPKPDATETSVPPILCATSTCAPSLAPSPTDTSEKPQQTQAVQPVRVERTQALLSVCAAGMYINAWSKLLYNGDQELIVPIVEHRGESIYVSTGAYGRSLGGPLRAEFSDDGGNRWWWSEYSVPESGLARINVREGASHMRLRRIDQPGQTHANVFLCIDPCMPLTWSPQLGCYVNACGAITALPNGWVDDNGIVRCPKDAPPVRLAGSGSVHKLCQPSPVWANPVLTGH